MEELKHLGILFMSEGIMEWELNRWIGVASAVMLVCCGEDRAESKAEVLNVPVSLCSHTIVMSSGSLAKEQDPGYKQLK